MDPVAAQLAFFSALGAVVFQAAALVLAGVLVYEKVNRVRTRIGDVVAAWALPITFLFTSAATAAALLFSEVFGFVPCGLCWFQRIALFPQVLIAGVALVKRQAAIVADYLLGLSVFGAIVALYQHYLQMGGSEFIACPTSGGAAGDCAQRIIFEFGYVTFPLIAFSLFVFIIALMLLVRSRIRQVSETVVEETIVVVG